MTYINFTLLTTYTKLVYWKVKQKKSYILENMYINMKKLRNAIL